MYGFTTLLRSTQNERGSKWKTKNYRLWALQQGTFPSEPSDEAKPPTPPPGPRFAWRKTIGLIWQERHPRFRRWSLNIFSVLFAVVFIALARSHRHDPDLDTILTNFLVAFLPLAFTVFIALVPEWDKKGKMRPIWRLGVMACGLIYGLVVWHQQNINLAASQKSLADSNSHVDQQLAAANAHADEKIAEANLHADHQNEEVKKHSDEKLAGLEKTLSEEFFKGNSQLGESISKVGKPDPPDPVTLQFSLWADDVAAQMPILRSPMTSAPDRVFPVEFVILNLSQTTAAHLVDVWIDICDLCEFSKEPDGFDRPTGMRKETRHLLIQLLNPLAATDKKKIEVRLLKAADSFDIGLRYSCELCGRSMTAPEQTARILVQYALPQDRGIRYSPVIKK